MGATRRTWSSLYLARGTIVKMSKINKLEKIDKINEKEKLEKTKDKKIAKTETRDGDFKKTIEKKR